MITAEGKTQFPYVPLLPPAGTNSRFGFILPPNFVEHSMGKNTLLVPLLIFVCDFFLKLQTTVTAFKKNVRTAIDLISSLFSVWFTLVEIYQTAIVLQNNKESYMH